MSGELCALNLRHGATAQSALDEGMRGASRGMPPHVPYETQDGGRNRWSK